MTMIMKLNIGEKTVAAHADTWDDTTQQGVAIVSGVRVLFICDAAETANFNPFHYGYIEEIEIGNMVLAYPEGEPVWMKVKNKTTVLDGKVVLYELKTAGDGVYYTTAAFLNK